MAKTKTPTNTLYDVTIAGTYFAATDLGHQTTKPYQVTVKMSQRMVDAGALSSFCKHLADDTLPTKYPDYIRFATHQIVSCERADGTPIDDIKLMNREQLIEHINDNDYPIEVELYPDDMQLQQAVLDYNNDEESFVKAHKQQREKRGDTLSIKAEAKTLNEIATKHPLEQKPKSKDPLEGV